MYLRHRHTTLLMHVCMHHRHTNIFNASNGTRLSKACLCPLQVVAAYELFIIYLPHLLTYFYIYFYTFLHCTFALKVSQQLYSYCIHTFTYKYIRARYRYTFDVAFSSSILCFHICSKTPSPFFYPPRAKKKHGKEMVMRGVEEMCKKSKENKQKKLKNIVQPYTYSYACMLL